MTKIKMIAGDTISISAVSSEPLQVGDPFELDTEDDAVRLEAAGHTRAGAKQAPAKAKPAK